MKTTDALIDVFRRGGLREAANAYQRATQRGPLARAGAAALENLVPVRALCTALLRYDADVGAHGIGAGSRRMLEEWGVRPRYEMHPRTWQVLAEEPFLAFGNHACGLEPALFNALLVREDVYFLAGDFVASVGPHLARMVLPLARTGGGGPAPRGVRDRTLAAVEQAVWPVRDDFAARRANAAQLACAARLIAGEGGGVHLFPSGSLQQDAPWRPGAGHLVRLLLRARAAEPGGRPVHLVPMVYGVRDAHLLASRLPGPRSALRAAARLRLAYADPGPYVYADAPVPLDALTPAGPTGAATAVELTARLHRIWAEARDNAARAIPGWRAAPAELRPEGTR
ncbi:hypothetical protein [Streptacidiphilus jiangxiensis]|uniref:Acyltransferase n=1 Tax=Streptacidiphilus jiangxiensis TaxID=235985 RepID=A0A1H7WI65_STRJI|nr:hypothetical protein [Streptacidiphilus jiangxiensis]SEM21181.1 hypothetical protein SAMN05414137_120179 [Streptacidiphilus jiangxiensis]